jgi:serine/threonine protein kinase
LAAAATATRIAGKKGQDGADSALNAAHDKQKMTEKQLAELEKHLIQVIDVFYAPEEASVKIVMEYMNGGSCDDLMKRGELLDETALAAIAIGAINSLVALHAKQRMHRDIKPANVLIDSKHGSKLCDLGLARHMLATKGGESHENDAVADTFVGTISYMSIERLEGKSYSYPADVHALGLTLLALALGSNPMRNLSFFQLLELLRSADCLQVPPEVEARYEPAFCQMLRDCTRSKPELRPTAKELQEYEWVKKYQRPDMPDSQNVLLSLIERTSEGPRYKRDMVNSIVARTNAHYVKTNMNRSKPRKIVVSLSKVRTLSEQLRVPVRQTIKAFKYNAANI